MKLNLGTLTVASDDFKHGEALPAYATVNGEGVSPSLNWSGIPADARSLAIVCTDPDAPLTHGFDHWTLYDISPTVSGLHKGAHDVGTGGLNGKGEAKWTPAAPPPGHGLHTYYFHLFALDAELGLPAALTRRQLLERRSTRTSSSRHV